MCSSDLASRATLLSLLQDYPKSPYAPQALMGLAVQAGQRGELQDALGYLERVRTDYADAQNVMPEALLTRARLLEQNDRWPEALETYRALPVQHPISEAALAAPLEIVNHYARLHDEKAVSEALATAERHYREFVARYPPGPYSVSARDKLARTLALQKRYNEAVSELVELGESMSKAPQGANYLLGAARMAYKDMNDSRWAAEILDRTGKLYPNTDVGRWASTEAARLREATPQ